MSNKSSISVLFVCLGNICRSPTSEGVFLHCVQATDLDLKIKVDSAGTANYHAGQPPDSRAIAAAAKRGINLKKLRARRVVDTDFQRFDYIVAMDYQNHADLVAMAPAEHQSQICMFMDFTELWSEKEIPDPYYGGEQGFERTLDMIEDASYGLIDHIKSSTETV